VPYAKRLFYLSIAAAAGRSAILSSVRVMVV